MLIQFFLFFILLFFSGFFSGTETALFSLKYYQIVRIIEEDSRKGELIKSILSRPRRLLSTILFGNMVVNIFMSSLAASLFLSIIGDSAELISIIIMTFVLLIFGEVSPKLLAVKNAAKFSKKVVGFMAGFSKISRPFTVGIEWITDLSMKILHISFGIPSDKLGKSELKEFFNNDDHSAVLDTYEKQMILNLYRFSDEKVKEIMRPRTEVFMIEYSDDLESIVGKVKEINFSRIPVYETDKENIVGILYVKDLVLLFESEHKQNFKLQPILKKPYFIPEYKSVDELFMQFMKKYIHFAVIVDEYGGFSGIITLEDILEEIIGEIKDKHNLDPEIIKHDEDSFTLEGRMELDEFNKRFNLELESGEADTLNGLLLEYFGEIPDQGQEITIKNATFKMIEVSNNKIEKIKVTFK